MKLRPVSNLVLIKKVIDGDNDELELIGTIVQTIFDDDRQGDSNSKKSSSGDEDKNSEEDPMFPMRFNDEAGDDKAPRRTLKEGKADVLWTATYDLKVPFRFEDVFNAFPFKIQKGTVTIELNKNEKYRPNLLLHKTDWRNTVSIQESKPGGLNTKLDRSMNYDFLSMVPEVRYFVEEKDKEMFCSKLEISFYFVEGGIAKALQVILPMILIATMNTINVLISMSDPHVHTPSEYLANSATFALTAVLLLSEVYDKKSIQNETISMNTCYIVFAFFGLILSSIPAEIINDSNGGVPLAGMGVLWFSFVFPFISAASYVRSKYKILYELEGTRFWTYWAKRDGKNLFQKDSTFKQEKSLSNFCACSTVITDEGTNPVDKTVTIFKDSKRVVCIPLKTKNFRNSRCEYVSKESDEDEKFDSYVSFSCNRSGQPTLLSNILFPHHS